MTLVFVCIPLGGFVVYTIYKGWSMYSRNVRWAQEEKEEDEREYRLHKALYPNQPHMRDLLQLHVKK